MRGIGRSILILVVTLFVAWLVLNALGFEMALGSSLAISVVLTVIVNLLMRRGR